MTQDVTPLTGTEMWPDNLPEITLREFLLWLFRFRKRFRVTGPSMRPLLKPGDEVLVNPRAYRWAQPALGDIVVAQHPTQANLQLIKRVVLVLEDGRCILKGDNLAFSTDSRSFGAVPSRLILGRVICRFA